MRRPSSSFFTETAQDALHLLILTHIFFGSLVERPDMAEMMKHFAICSRYRTTQPATLVTRRNATRDW
ncbi:MAG: hypothetical protein ACRDHZ_13800, partial [Ktedonobacteraceae bacterium]